MALSPPTIIASCPDKAPLGPPLTGASNTCEPILENSANICRIKEGELVLRSMYVLPGPMPSIMPFSPKETAATSVGPGREVNTTSDKAATVAGSSAQVAPFSSSSAAAAWFKSWTMRFCPELSILAAMPLPILPRPINPMFNLVSPFRGMLKLASLGYV